MSKIDESAKNRVLVLGKGTSGKAAAMLAGQKGKAVDFADGYELVVASPGVRVMSELEYGCRELRRRGTKLLAVTGSKGKSSVVKLVADALSLAGHEAVPCGNYGTAVSEVAMRPEVPEWAVVEVSSFMMETTNLPPDTFEAAAVVNLQEDHLDRHGSLALYHALKRRLLSFAKVAIDGTSLPTGGRRVPKGCYFDNDVLGANGAVAAELMRAAGVGGEDVEQAFLAFKPLHHRFELVAEIGGVRFVDDSKATSVAALVAGVEMAQGGVRLIAGGLSKGDDPKIARGHLTKRAKKVYLIGQCAEEFRAAWADAVDCEVCGTMERAVEAAMRDAEKGDTVLLSPGTASFDQFTNFEVRGEVFASLVKKEGQKTK